MHPKHSHVRLGLTLLCLLAAGPGLLAVDPPPGPTVANITVQRQAGTKLVDITYDLNQPQGLPCTVAVEVSQDGGATWLTAPLTLTGAVGTAVTPDLGKLVTWNAGTDWPAQRFTTTRVRVTADDLQGNMVLIPAGTFAMGDSKDEGWPEELPVHTVTVSAFSLWKTELTYAQWQEVYAWNQSGSHGYDFDVGAGKAGNHPVQMVSWYDAVKWCNARSRMDGLTPCYYTDAGFTTELKTGYLNFEGTDYLAVFVNWSANGYRLPTEAEWEYAARGGTTDGRRFPWGDAITHSEANYSSSASDSYDVSPTRGYHPAFNDGVFPYTAPVGSFMANAFGLHDMAGNGWEWCWDWSGEDYYSTSPLSDPRGPDSGFYRMIRGGGWGGFAHYCRAANRNSDYPDVRDFLGFRPARSSAPTYSAISPVIELNLLDAESYASWRLVHFTAPEIADLNLSGPNADPDGDGFVNLMEYALDLAPQSPSTGDLPGLSTDATYWVYAYTRPTDRTDLTYAVEVSTNLADWTTNAVIHEQVSAAGAIETWRAKYLLTSANVFFRLKISTQ